jgi:hypothetical protein
MRRVLILLLLCFAPLATESAFEKYLFNVPSLGGVKNTIKGVGSDVNSLIQRGARTLGKPKSSQIYGNARSSTTRSGTTTVGGKVSQRFTPQASVDKIKTTGVVAGDRGKIIIPIGQQLWKFGQFIVFGVLLNIVYFLVGVLANLFEKTSGPASWLGGKVLGWLRFLQKWGYDKSTSSSSNVFVRVFGLLIRVVTGLVVFFIIGIATIIQGIFKTATIIVTVKLLTLITLIVATLVANYVEDKYSLLVDTANAGAVAYQSAFNKGAEYANIALEFRDTVQPIANQQVYSTVALVRLLCGTFCEEDQDNVGNRRSLLLEIPNEYEPVPGGSVAQRVHSYRGAVAQVTFASHLMDVLQRAIIGFQLIIIEPFLETIGAILSKVFAKLSCIMSAPAGCTLLEFLNLLARYAVDGLNAVLKFLGVNIKYRSFGCTAGSLPHTPPGQCQGYMFDPRPEGAFFSNLVANPGSRRLEEEEPEKTYRMLTCDEDKKDGSFVERLDGKVVHRSHRNKCPLSRHVFRDDISNVHQFNMLEIDDKCYRVCLHGVLYESCHSMKDGHTRNLVGSCHPDVQIHNETAARRRLGNIFPDTLFQWNKRVLTSPVPDPFRFIPKTATTTVPKTLVDQVKEAVPIKTFTVLGVECTLVEGGSYYDQWVNTICITAKLMVDKGPSMSDVINNMFTVHEARHLEEVEDNWDYGKFHQSLMKHRDFVVGAFTKMKRHRRLLHTTDSTKTPSERLDEMIQYTQYKVHPRRSLIADQSVVTQPTVQDIGACEGTDMYPCITGECVPVEDRGLCPRPDLDDPELSWAVKVGYYLTQASTFEADPVGLLDDASTCYKGYDENGDTLPFTYANLVEKEGNEVYCLGMSGDIGYRITPYEHLTGINELVNTGCSPANTNTCKCGWYPLKVYDDGVIGFLYMTVDLRIRLLRALISIQWLLYRSIFIWFPVLDAWWASLWDMFRPGYFSPVFLHIFGDLGLGEAVTEKRRWLCFGIHLGSLLTFVWLVVVFFIFWEGFDKFRQFLRSSIHSFTGFLFSCCRSRR